jgi:hypothetical protein
MTRTCPVNERGNDHGQAQRGRHFLRLRIPAPGLGVSRSRPVEPAEGQIARTTVNESEPGGQTGLAWKQCPSPARKKGPTNDRQGNTLPPPSPEPPPWFPARSRPAARSGLRPGPCLGVRAGSPGAGAAAVAALSVMTARTRNFALLAAGCAVLAFAAVFPWVPAEPLSRLRVFAAVIYGLCALTAAAGPCWRWRYARRAWAARCNCMGWPHQWWSCPRSWHYREVADTEERGYRDQLDRLRVDDVTLPRARFILGQQRAVLDGTPYDRGVLRATAEHVRALEAPHCGEGS